MAAVGPRLPPSTRDSPSAQHRDHNSAHNGGTTPGVPHPEGAAETTARGVASTTNTTHTHTPPSRTRSSCISRSRTGQRDEGATRTREGRRMLATRPRADATCVRPLSIIAPSAASSGWAWSARCLPPPVPSIMGPASASPIAAAFRHPPVQPSVATSPSPHLTSLAAHEDAPRMCHCRRLIPSAFPHVCLSLSLLLLLLLLLLRLRLLLLLPPPPTSPPPSSPPPLPPPVTRHCPLLLGPAALPLRPPPPRLARPAANVAAT
ncbi:hypothetical protein CDD83_9574 [Cordyceps sp. RAO-2017]|nr:hypothetical protein CDD83_9574 [Cordyceps sp. RAO-2017]